MKNKFLSKAYGGVREARSKHYCLGLPRQWKVITSTLLLLFTFAIGNVWAANTPAAAGTYVASSSKKPGGENKFYKLGNGVYIHRRNNSSWDSSLGMKTTSTNTNGLAVYVSSSMNFSGLIKKSSSKNAVTVQFDIYTLTNGSTAFDSFESGTDNSTTVSVTLSSTPTYTTTVSFEALATNAAEEKSSSNLALAAGYYYIVPHETASIGKTFIYSITLTAASKDDPTITFTDGAYTVGGSNLDLSSLFSSNSDGAVTYTVKTDGGTSASISGSSFSATAAGTAVVTASQAATSTYNAASKDANIVVSVPSTPTHEITYTNLKGSDVSAYPTEFYEGVGIASFDPLADVTDFHFNGWSPASIGTDVATDVEMTATWVAAYDVTFNINGGTGSAPDAFQKWEGATFELPGQGSMVAPSGRVFGGWKAGGTKYAASAEYTMTNAAVEFVAQWDLLVEQVLYSWEGAEGGATEVGGTATHYNADAAVDGNPRVNYKTTANSVDYYTISLNGKADYSTDHIRIALTTNAKAGDKVKMTAFYSKDSEKTVAPKISNSSNTELVTGTTPPNIYSSGVPTLQTVTLPVGADEAELRLTRSTTATNVFITKLQIVREKAVPEEDVRTVTFNTNGGSSIAAVSLEKGTAVARPADPTKAHCRFEGWQLSGSDYDFSSAVNSNITLDAVWTQLYTISFAAGDGSGDAPAAIADKAKDETFEVPANTFTAPASKEFDKWNDGSADYAPGATYTVGTANVVLTAQWKAVTAKYTVIFKDGETTLDTKLFEVGSNPSDADIDKTKPLFAFAAWQKEGVDIALDDAFWATVAKDAEITLTARWAKAYGSNVDFEAYILANTGEADDADKAEAYVIAQNYALSTKTNTTFDANNSTNNGAYAGLKIKNSGTTLSWNVVAGKVVELKAGVMVANGSLAINGGAATTIDGGSTSSGNDNFKMHYFYSAAEALYVFTTSNGSAEVIKAITMRDPYEVSYDVDGGDPVAAQYGEPSVTLPLPTKGTENFAGWYTDADEFVGMNGDSYTPTADIELVAHWEALSTVNTLSDLKVDGVTVDGFSADVHTYYIVLPYGTDVASLPKITAATPTNENASVAIWPTEGPAWTDDFGGCYRQQANVTPQDPTAAVGYNDIRITIAPKDGTPIISIAVPNGTGNQQTIDAADITGFIGGTATQKLQSGSTKLGNNGHYIGFTLANSATLQAGDIISLNVSATNGASHLTLYQDASDANLVKDIEWTANTGVNLIPLPAEAIGLSTLYIYRTSSTCNPSLSEFAILRPMNPVMTAITLAGVAADKDSEFAFSATLPNGTNLASMTVVPTIYWNGAGTAEPTAAWDWGENTYRVTDKDGDYTDYTITLTEAAAPSAAPVITAQPIGDDYIEGAAIAALEVTATGSGELSYQWYLGADAIDGATAATYAPAVSAIGTYVYHCVVTNTEAGHPGTSLASDNATITIAENPAAIKLLDGEGNINTTDFITGVSKNTVTIDEVEHNCATFGSTAQTVVGASGLNKFIIYNAKTNQTMIKFVLYNSSSSAQKLVLQKLAEGGDAVEEIEIDVPSKEEFTTDYYTYNSSLNRTMYAFVKNTNIKVLQVKVIDNGTQLKQFGEVGYSINFNQGRLFLNSGTDAAYDGMTYNASSNYAPLTNSGLSITKSKAYSFSVPAAATMTVTAANNAKYYITQTEDGEDNETAVAAATSFDLTAGTWYLRVAGSNLSVTNIAFSAPKCEKPAFTSLANVDLCEGDPFTAINGAATVSDGGTISYQWYNEDDSEISGATAATFTPSADGKYYVIATNTLAGFADNFAKSDLVMVQHLANAVITAAPKNVRDDAGNEFTLTVAATGKNLSYEWFTCNEDGTGAVAVDPACTATSFTANVPAVTTYYKVVVSSDCGSAEALAKVEPWVDFVQVSVSDNTTWDFTTCADAQIKLDDSTTPKKGEECLMANIRVNGGVHFDDPTFNAQALIFAGEYIYRNVTGKPLGAITLKFTTTVDGFVTVRFADNGNNNRCLRVTDSEGVEYSQSSASNSDIQEFTTFVHAGDVEIMGMSQDKASDRQYVRIFNLAFEKADYSRAVNAGRYGTICLPNGGVMKGAEIFEIAYYGATSQKIFFDQIMDGVMEAGVPYLFLPKEGYKYLGVEYTDALNASATNRNGLYGSYSKTELPSDGSCYILLNNQYCQVLSAENYVGANKAYFKLGDITPTEPALAPGRHRIALGGQGSEVATGMENINADEAPMKVMINGELFILFGDKMYDATGRLVK